MSPCLFSGVYFTVMSDFISFKVINADLVRFLQPMWWLPTKVMLIYIFTQTLISPFIKSKSEFEWFGNKWLIEGNDCVLLFSSGLSWMSSELRVLARFFGGKKKRIHWGKTHHFGRLNVELSTCHCGSRYYLRKDLKTCELITIYSTSLT